MYLVRKICRLLTPSVGVKNGQGMGTTLDFDLAEGAAPCARRQSAKTRDFKRQYRHFIS
jgi:hypothetical protein